MSLRPGSMAHSFVSTGRTGDPCPPLPCTVFMPYGAPGPTTAFAAGSFGTLLHFDGAQWAPVRTDHAIHFESAWGPNADVVYFAGHEGAIYRLTRGATW